MMKMRSLPFPRLLPSLCVHLESLLPESKQGLLTGVGTVSGCLAHVGDSSLGELSWAGDSMPSVKLLGQGARVSILRSTRVPPSHMAGF